MAEFFNRVLSNLIDRKTRVEEGKLNCIPCPFPRFRNEWPGIEQGRYYGVTAQQKVGKTKLANYLFLYHPFFFAFNNPEKLRIKIFYISLEMGKEELYEDFICHLLYVCSKGKIRIAQKDLKSTNADRPLPQEVIDVMNTKEYQDYFNFFEEHVEIITSIRNPTGIYKLMRDYAIQNGVQHKKVVNFINNKTGETVPKELDDYYEPNDPDEYVILIIDHVSLIDCEKETGGSRMMDLRDSMIKLSANYLIQLRNKYKYIPVVIQQQAIAGESLDNFKLGKLKPSVADLGEAKVLARDYNLLISLFSPFRHEIKDYLGYNITKFQDYIRFMEIVSSREGGGGTMCPLYFDGAVNYFHELPLPSDTSGVEKALERISQAKSNKVFLLTYKIINKINGKSSRNFWSKWGWKNNKCNYK